MRDATTQPPLPPPERERAFRQPIIVAISGGALSMQSIRSGQRLAVAADRPWLVAHVRCVGWFRRAAAAHDATLTRAFSLAERLGARTVTVSDRSVANALLRLAQTEGASQIVVGQSRPRPPFWPSGGRIEDRLRAAGAAAGIHVIARQGHAESYWRLMLARAGRLALTLYPYAVGSAAAVAGAVGGHVLDHALGGETRVSGLPPLTAAGFAALSYGLWPGLYATALTAVLTIALVVPAEARLGAHSLLLAAGILALGGGLSYFVERARQARRAGDLREARLRALFRFSRDIGAAPSAPDVLRAIVEQVDDILDARTIVLLPTGPEGLLQVAYPPGAELSPADAEAAEWAFHFDDLSGRGTNTIEEASRLYQPMRGTDGAVGVLGMGDADEANFHDLEYRWLLDALAGLAAGAIERTDLARRLADARVVAEADSLRGALLSSISHDLRTPLATIIGSASTLQAYGASLDAETRHDLLSAIREEAERLNRFVRNLLEMTKIEAGAVLPRRQWVALEDIIGAALERVGPLLRDAEVRTRIAPDLPLAYLDFVQIEQVLVNLIENAVHYSPDQPVEVTADADIAAGCFRIAVIDHGAGIAAEDLSRIFDKFYRAQYRDRKIAGTGLGLSICKGLVEAHGGTIRATSDGADHGSRFTVELPLETADHRAAPGVSHAEGQ